MSVRSAEAILGDLATVTRTAFPDRDFPDATSETRVFADLGLASIDVVVLGEQLEAHYGRTLPFGQFLTALRNASADDFTLGELTEFLQAHVGGP